MSGRPPARPSTPGHLRELLDVGAGGERERVRGGEHDRRALAVELPPELGQLARSTSGEIGLVGGRLSQTIATSPRVSSAMVSRCRRRAAGRGRSPGRSSCRAGPGPPAGAGSVGGANASPHSGSARSSASTTSSRPRSSARANGPGRIPAPVIIPMSMSLTSATPSSSTRQRLDQRLEPEALDERVEPALSCRAHRSPSRSSGRGRRPRRAPASSARRRSARRSSRCRCSATWSTVSRPSRSLRKNGPIGAVPDS